MSGAVTAGYVCALTLICHMSFLILALNAYTARRMRDRRHVAIPQALSSPSAALFFIRGKGWHELGQSSACGTYGCLRFMQQRQRMLALTSSITLCFSLMAPAPPGISYATVSSKRGRHMFKVGARRGCMHEAGILCKPNESKQHELVKLKLRSPTLPAAGV